VHLVVFVIRMYHDARSYECQTMDDVQLVQGTISPGVKRPGNDATHSPLTSANVKTVSAVTPLPRLITSCHEKDTITFLC
jgi:hypothetical protein